MLHKFSGLEKRKILVVEDVELNQYLARHIMESWGCIVNVAENGLQAVEKMNIDDYDLVLMDIQMPVMDGIEATRHIREMNDKKKASTPIVALTANAMPNEFGMYLKAGMNDCMQKPFEEPALYQIISKNIRNPQAAAVVADGSMEPGGSPSVLYDLSMVESISGGDRTFVVKMLRLFLDTVPVTLHDLRTASNQQDWQQVSKLAHKLKSTVDSMGISPLKQEVRIIESNGKSGTDTGSLPARVENVVAVMEKVMDQVRNDHSL